MSEDTHHLLAELIQEMRGMREELRVIRTDIALMADDHRTSKNMQSPLMGRDLFHDEEPSALARAR